MDIQSNIHNASAVITISSNILGTPADSKEFEKNIQGVLTQGIKKLILDLRDVKRINSTGLAILITGFHLLTNSGGTLVLANLNDFVKGALTITKLDHVFQYYNSVDEALVDQN
jgi:anti-sigma B factor antagonist